MASSLTDKYKKWDKLELSDDEDDVHPNIDKQSWFRWKHQARVEREMKEKHEQEILEEKNKMATARKVELQAQMQQIEEGVDNAASKEELIGMRAELAEIEKDMQQRCARLEEMDRNRKLNVDNVGTVVKDYTFINTREGASDVLPDSLNFIPKPSLDSKSAAGGSATKSTSSAVTVQSTDQLTKELSTAPSRAASTDKPGGLARPSAGVGPHSELDAAESYNNFVLGHEKLLEDFSEVTSLEQAQEMLHKEGHILLAEHSQSYLLLSCLEDEMNGKHARMKNTARQSQILSHITELAHSLDRSPRDVVVPFFRRLQEPVHLKGFSDAVQDFIVKVQKRAVEKRKEMAEARARGEEVDGLVQEEEEEVALGPGGLNPIQVFQELPPVLQEAFESRDMNALRAALAAMPAEEARRHMKACEDSGLWVPHRGDDETVKEEHEISQS
ncbi:cdc37 protein [Nannochloropsis gaditana]|uniref:Hsp90 chaperone protein kinase-targeting subunit n=1 Tax=Nannochloropsis gaditana TaxID=72520 RepID=W7TC69_9STRA|nr:cdc37 protein [Nannochloropsis gaditana]